MQSDLGTPTHVLAPHVFACECAGEVVMLDVKRDKYLSLPRRDSASLGAWVRDWPVPAPSAVSIELDTPDGADQITRLLGSMVANGMLEIPGTRDARRAADRTTSVSRDWTREWTGRIDDANGALRPHDVLRYAIATAKAVIIVRQHSFERLIARAVRIRSRHARSCGRNEDDVFAIVSRHRQLRPWFFTATNNCVLECLVLLELLASCGHEVWWTFGVRTKPFAAHCWIHCNQMILNDTIENICRFSPIMTI